MSFKVGSFIETFTDLDGTPLESGYIYIGIDGKNPEIEDNQIQVYWDEGLTIPAAQPIRTIAGYPDRSGAPSAIFVGTSPYSITVRNKNRLIVYSELSVDDKTVSPWAGAIEAEYVSATSYKYPGVNIASELPVNQRVLLNGPSPRTANIVSSSFTTDTIVIVENVQTIAGAPSTVDAAMTSAALSIDDHNQPMNRGVSTVSTDVIAGTIAPSPGRTIDLDGSLWDAVTSGGPFTSDGVGDGAGAIIAYSVDNTKSWQRRIEDDVVYSKWWGTDQNLALPAAITFADSRYVVEMPEGTHIITNQVDMLTSTDTTNVYQPTNSLRGAGKYKTTIINRTGTNWLIHKPSASQVDISGAGARFLGFSLSHMNVITDGSSPAGSAGALIYSAWQGECHDYEETGMKGNGFTIPLDAALHANPDRYSCGLFRMWSVRFQSNDGIGLNCESPSLTLSIDDYYIVGNKTGGFFLTGASHDLGVGSIAGNGETAAANGYGLKLAHSTGFTHHNTTARGIEIDNNYGRDVIIEGYNNDLKCRIIQNGASGFKASDMIYIDSTTSGGAYSNRVNAKVRIDSPTANPLNIVTTTDSAGTENNTVEILYSTDGDDSNVVKANLLGTTRERNIVIESNQVIGASHQGAIHNINKSFVKPSASVTLTTTAAILKFSKTWDDMGLWSDANWQFTAPRKGLCTINFSAPFRAIVVNDPITLSIHINGSATPTQSVEFDDGVATTTGKHNLSFVATVPVSSGDTVEIRGATASANGASFRSDADTTVKFEME